MQTKQIQRLLDVNPDPVFVAERGSGRILYSNSAFGRKAADRADISAKNLYEIFPESEKQNLNLLLEGEIKEGEFHFKLDDGKLLKQRLQAVEFDRNSLIVTVKEEFNLWKTDFQAELIDKLNDAVISTNLNHEILSWNKAAERMYGWMEDEALGKKMDDLIKSEITESDVRKYLNDMEMQGVFHQIETGRHKNGYPVFTESRKISVHDSEGKVSGYIMVNKDITTRLKALAELDKSEEIYKKIFDHNPLPVAIYKEDDFSILKANRATEKKYGFKVEEIEKMKITDFLPPKELETYINELRWDTSETRWGKYSTLNKSGEKVYIEYTSTYINYQGEKARIVVVNDISENLKQEEKMREYSLKLETIISNLPMILLELDENKKFILVEGRAVQDTGFKQKDLIGKSAIDIVEDIQLTQTNGRVLSGKEAIERVWKDEMVTGHSQMGGIFFDNYFVPVKKDENRISGLLGVALDITERVNFEKSLHSTEERFMLIAENTSELISMVSGGKYMYVSPSYKKVLGYTVDEIKEMSPLSLVHPDDKIILKDWESMGMFEFRIKNKKGDWLWVEGERFIIQGDPKITVGIARDITKRKHAEEALRENEERYRLLFERNPLPMFVRDEKTMRFLAANEAAVKHYGYPIKELLKMTIKDIRPPEDIPILMNVLEHQGSGISKLGTFRHLKKNGEIIDVDVTTHKIMFDGQPARLVLANDITDRVIAQRALQQSEEKYRRIVENADEGIFLLDQEYKIIFVNPKMAAIAGYKTEEIENRSVFDFIYDADKEKAFSVIMKNREGKSEKFEFRIIHRDGTARLLNVNAVPIFDENGNYVGGLAFVTDITQQRKAEAAYQRTNETLRALINYSPLSIIILDKDGKVDLWNPACERMFGWESKEVIGRMLPIVPPEKKEEHAGLRKTIMDGKSFTGQEVERRKKDGGKIDISLSASPLFDAEHHPIGISSFLIDVTDKKLAEKEREQLFKEVTSARNRLKILSSRLISVQETEKQNISRELHDEIGQMLTAVKIDVQRIRDESGSEVINSIADDCKKLVEETISVVRNLSLELRPSIIDDLGLEASLRWYTDKFYQRTGIEVKTEINQLSSTLPPDCAITLFRICQEALTNIAKHSKADYVKVTLNQKNNQINLSVEDNGKGFDLEKALKLAAKGKSLGLLGMQERAELTGGNLKVISKEGSGTKVNATCQV